MKLSELKAQIALGEDSHRQFKQDVTNADGLAAEVAAFANSEGGTIFLGVDDDGTLPGFGQADVGHLNQLISNAASQHVRSPLTVRTENVAVSKGRIVIVLHIPPGERPLKKSSEKSSGKTDARILELLRHSPEIL